MAFGQSGPITFCAANDDQAAIWMMRHHVEHNRFYVRRPDMDRGCLDKAVGYEAVEASDPRFAMLQNLAPAPEWKSCALKIWRETDHRTLECLSGDTLASQFLSVSEPLDVPAIPKTHSILSCYPSPPYTNNDPRFEDHSETSREPIDGNCIKEGFELKSWSFADSVCHKGTKRLDADHCQISNGAPPGMWDACVEDICEPVMTCKDKNRILERDENEPPKYWCRKVQN